MMEVKSITGKPANLFEKLEFDKVLHLVAEACQGELGKAKALAVRPLTDLSAIQQLLREVHEYKNSITENDHFPSAPYFDLDEELKLLEIVDYVLPEEGLQNINRSLRLMQAVFRFFTERRIDLYPTLYSIIRSVTFDESLIQEIDRVIDEEGHIKSDASPELAKIRKAIGGKQRELDRTFRLIINEYRNRGWLTDSAESFRNGRRVLSVPSEHKRKIRGIIHDESSTGKTAFIEPDGIIDINNDIFDLQQREKREIYRILKTLSAVLRPYVPHIRIYQSILIRYDLIQAKARLAVAMNAAMPGVVGHPKLKFIEGRHPLLYLKNKPAGKNTVPFTLDLQHQNRVLMLSGPNAGGKSITMKSVGLMQLMLQSGMLVPADELSEFGIFKQIFADIGDQQSIEDDLSTYSSRLKNMKEFLEASDPHTLLLIDEFGSGTDPKIGGAIAEAILQRLNQLKVFGVVTTHYSNLKIFAFKTKGIVNGSMHFDKDTLSPTYELKVGRPGSSYAFEIAEKSGLPAKVLDFAKHRTGKQEKAVDQLLVELQREKQELEEQIEVLKERESKLERLIKTYDQMHRDMEFRRKKLKLEAKEQALQQTALSNKDLEKLIREIREEKNLEKAKELSSKVKEERKVLRREVAELQEEVYFQAPAPPTDRPLEVGSSVKMRSGGAIGIIESIDRNKAVVLMGQMRMTVRLRDLLPARESLEIQSQRSVQVDTASATQEFDSRIDIRGMRFEEALGVVEDFIDQALISNIQHLRIVHGKGSGSLRKAVRQKLREYNIPMEISHPDPEKGGDGVTLIELQ